MANITGKTIALESVLRILLAHRRARPYSLATRIAIRKTIALIRKLK